MAIKSLSDLYNYSLFIFDLDNTIYNEEDYLLQAYMSISQKFEGIAGGYNKNTLFEIMMDIYRKEGREKLFDKFLFRIGLDTSYITDCLKIIRTFDPGIPIEITAKVRNILSSLGEKGKQVYVLTNGNPEQQKNKIKNIRWEGLDKNIVFIMANDFEPKPSPAGIIYILKTTRTDKTEAIMIGDSEIDLQCAVNGKIEFVNIKDLA